MSWQSIRQFFRENPLAWVVGAVAVVVLLVFVWAIWGGSSFQFSNFFAEEPPTANLTASPATVAPGGTVNISWSSTNATACSTVAGTFSTGNQPSGSATDTISPSTAATEIQYRIQCTGLGGTTLSNIALVSISVGSTPTPTPPAGGGRTDPTGACVYRTTADAPNGGWYCRNLQCPLNGSPDGSAPQPATRAVTKYFHGTCNGTTISGAQIGCTGIWDMTPQDSSGREGYPAQDPHWTCTGPFTLGRSDCYNPSGTFTAAGLVTCQANSGLPGDSASITVPGNTVITPTPSIVTGTPTPTPVGATPTPTPNLSPTPTPVYPLLQCSPQNQTVMTRQTATVAAVGGNGKYQWDLSGSGIQMGGTATSVDVSYSVPGNKVVRVNSAGQVATCGVTVLEPGGGAQSFLSVVKRGLNTVTGVSGDSTPLTVNGGETARFTVSITNNGTTPANNLRIRDMVPTGMSYLSGSTTVNGQVESSDVITMGGLTLDTLEPGSNVSVQWAAIADATSFLAAGPQQSRPQVVVSAVGMADTIADMSVIVYGSGLAGGPGGPGTPGSATGTAGGVATGPGDAVTIALMTAAALTLLYSGYTRSSMYRRHEADSVSRDQDPLDFRN